MLRGKKLTRRRLSLGLGASLTALAAGPVFGSEAIDIVVAEDARKLGDNGRPLSVLLPEGSRANLDPVAAAFKKKTGIQINLEEVHVDQINAN